MHFAELALHLIPLILQAISSAEQLHNATPADKRQHVVELVQTGSAAVNAISGKPLLDPGLIETAAMSIIGVIDGVKISTKLNTNNVTP